MSAIALRSKGDDCGLARGRIVGNTEVSPVSTKQSVAEDCAFLCGQLANFGNPGNLAIKDSVSCVFSIAV